MKKIILNVKSGMEKAGDRALFGMAAAARMVTVVNVHTCCWFVLGQDKLPDGAKKLRRF